MDSEKEFAQLPAGYQEVPLTYNFGEEIGRAIVGPDGHFTAVLKGGNSISGWTGMSFSKLTDCPELEFNVEYADLTPREPGKIKGIRSNLAIVDEIGRDDPETPLQKVIRMAFGDSHDINTVPPKSGPPAGDPNPNANPMEDEPTSK